MSNDIEDYEFDFAAAERLAAMNAQRKTLHARRPGKAFYKLSSEQQQMVMAAAQAVKHKMTDPRCMSPLTAEIRRAIYT